MAYTLVHCADVHLETVFAETRGGARRRLALMQAFARVVDEALERRADALTIGGDLYEAARAGPQTVRFLFEQFARFGRPVLIAPGNHDPHAPGSLLARADLPENVRVFNEAAWNAHPLTNDVVLYGFGHTPAEPGRPFPGARFDRGNVRIALVHGSDEERCPPNKRATAPFTQSEARAAGATLVLTGHYHGGYTVLDGDRPVLAYPGSLEPIKFGEGAQHGALAVTVEGDHVRVEPIPIARTRLLDVACDVTSASSESAIFASAERALAPFGRDDYVRLRLEGAIAHGTRVDPALLEERLGETLGSLDVTDATLAHDYAAIAREPTVRGHVVSELVERRRRAATGAAGNEDAGIVDAALRYSLAAFDGDEIAP